MNTSDKLRELKSEEQEFVQDAADMGKSICEHYLEIAAADVVVGDLDKTYEAWASDETDDSPSAEDIVEGLGGLLGELLLNQQYGQTLSWKIESLKADEEYAIAQHGTSLRVYPFNFVYKRVAEDEKNGGFFSALYGVISKELEG